MASRIIHLAIAYEIAKSGVIRDTERFCFGSVVPDAAPDKTAHFPIFPYDGTKKTLDLTTFRERYASWLAHDEFYLGYYLHLLEDIMFRYFMYTLKHYDPRPEGNIDILHHDYELTNRYVIEKYGLKLPVASKRIDEELVVTDFGLDAYGFIKDMQRDFTARPEGETVFFTEQRADEYIVLTTAICRREINALAGRGEHFDEYKYAWIRH